MAAFCQVCLQLMAAAVQDSCVLSEITENEMALPATPEGPFYTLQQLYLAFVVYLILLQIIYRAKFCFIDCFAAAL